MPTADVDDSLLWLLLSPLDGAGVLPLEIGLASMTSRCPPADGRCVAAAADEDADAPVLTGMPSNCCLLVIHITTKHCSSSSSSLRRIQINL